MIAQGQVLCPAVERVIYGRPAADALAEEVDRRDARRVFLLTSDSLRRNTDEIDRVTAQLAGRVAGIWSGMPPHGPRGAVLQAAAAMRQADADLLITIGGGSVTDAGKIMLMCLGNDVYSHEDFDAYRVRVEDDGTVVMPSLKPPPIRSITVPTTLSGGEFNPLGGATDERAKLKQGYEHRLLVPATIVLDPAITRHTPEWLWMSTGVRSFDHALETLGSFQSNDYCDGNAANALVLLQEGLNWVKADPNDMEGRLKCQMGVWHSMLPIVAGVPMGASHAIGHVLGGTCDVPHGYTSCVMAPFVLKFNAAVNADRQARISALLGAPEEPAWTLVDRFIAGLGMPRSLAAVGVGEADLPLIAENTMLDFWARTNPRPINSAKDVMEILRTAL
ncbi:MAG: iron-containing alcohol dehydrogenase [Sphingomonadales bacterium]